MTSAAPQDSHWFPGLEGLRGVAAMAMVVYHLRLPNFLGAGQGAMEVFFVLSGFLITAILLRDHDQHGTIRLGRFYLRRLRRLYPALVALVLAVSLVSLFLDPPGSPEAPLVALAYVMNLWELGAGNEGGVLDQTWSLAIEEQFYLAWPLALLLLLRLRGPRARLLAVAGLVALALLVRVAIVASEPGLLRIRNGTDVRAFGFLLGGLIAVARPFTVNRRVKSVAATLGAAFLAVLPAAVDHYVGLTFLTWWLVAPVATAAVIWRIAEPDPGWVGRLLSLRPLRWLGLISYSLYLWHPFTLWLSDLAVLVLLEGASATVRLGMHWLVGMTLSLAVSWLCFRLVERMFWTPAGIAEASPSMVRGAAGEPGHGQPKGLPPSP